VTLLAQQVKNVAVVTTPQTVVPRFKHVELVSIQPNLALVVLVLNGAKVRQQLVSFEEPAAQEILTDMAGKLNNLFSTRALSQIESKMDSFSAGEKRVVEHVLHMMQAEEAKSGQGLFLEGWHFLINQPEFSQGPRLVNLINLAEQNKLAELMRPASPSENGVRVIIGSENKDEAVQECSLIISRYGLPGEPLGSIAVVGPTRMEYERTIAVISYVSSLVSLLVTELYGENPKSDNPAN
jgi:heat-inducible transcriptional repressor